MAFKLSRQQMARRELLIEQLRDGHAALETAIQIFNDAVARAKDLVEEVGGDWRNQFDDMSESWQEGDKGQEVEQLVADWESMEFFDAEAAPDDPSDSLEELATGV